MKFIQPMASWSKAAAMRVGEAKGAKQASMEWRHSVEQMQSHISGSVWDRSNHTASPSMASCHTTSRSGCGQMGTCCALSMHSQERQVSEAAKPQSFIILFMPQKPLMCLVAQSRKSGGYPLRALSGKCFASESVHKLLRGQL